MRTLRDKARPCSPILPSAMMNITGLQLNQLSDAACWQTADERQFSAIVAAIEHSGLGPGACSQPPLGSMHVQPADAEQQLAGSGSARTSAGRSRLVPDLVLLSTQQAAGAAGAAHGAGSTVPVWEDCVANMLSGGCCQCSSRQYLCLAGTSEPLEDQ